MPRKLMQCSIVGMHQNPSWSTLGYFLINGRAGSIIIIMCYRYHYLMHQKSLQHTFIKNHEEIYLEVKAKHDLQSSQFWLFIFCSTFFQYFMVQSIGLFLFFDYRQNSSLHVIVILTWRRSKPWLSLKGVTVIEYHYISWQL